MGDPALDLTDQEYDEWDDTWYEDQVWSPGEEETDFDNVTPLFSYDDLKLPEIPPSVKPSQFTEFAFRMPAEDGVGTDGNGFSNFSFEGRRHMRRIYDTGSRRILLKCARQVEKSTLLGNISLCYMSLVPSFKILYVNSSATQAKTFSNDRIKDPIETSPILKRFTTSMLSSNILEKQFINRSKITLRYAYLNADRCRGIPAWALALDEFQDILSDNIPVIEQTTSHAPERWKRFFYSGTPKSLDNHIETYWSNNSTQNEWVVPCDAHGGEGGRYWNILGEKNIGRKGLICEKCGKLIHSMHKDSQWAALAKMDGDRVVFEGFRIPQLMVPWKPWDEILLDYNRYPRDKFYNEVLGLSYDSGLRPLTKDQIKACCNDSISMADIESYRQLGYAQPIFMGIDWGTGENSYTVVTLATYIDMKFRVFFMHRFTGEDTDPTTQLAKIVELIDYFNVALVGSDYGGGFDRNDHLVRKIGPQRLHKFQYMARAKKKVEYDQKLGRWKVARTEVMSDIFNAIKRGNQCQFPRWVEFEEPCAQDMLNIFSEYNEALRMIQYKHSIDKPDDCFHSFLYAWLVSMIIFKRPDIIAPRREEKGRPVAMNYGPTDQG